MQKIYNIFKTKNGYVVTCDVQPGLYAEDTWSFESAEKMVRWLHDTLAPPTAKTILKEMADNNINKIPPYSAAEGTKFYGLPLDVFSKIAENIKEIKK